MQLCYPNHGVRQYRKLRSSIISRTWHSGCAQTAHDQHTGRVCQTPGAVDSLDVELRRVVGVNRAAEQTSRFVTVRSWRLLDYRTLAGK